MHRELEVALRCVTDPSQERWDLDLPFVSWALNTTWSRVTDQTPFFLMFGRQPRTLVDAFVGSPVTHYAKADWMLRMERARRLAAARSGLARGVVLPDVRVPVDEEGDVAVHVGDLVLVKFTAKTEGLSRKLQPLQQGPYKVVAVRDGVTAQLERVDNPRDKVERHVSALVPYLQGAGESTGDNEWHVEEILDERTFDEEVQVLVRWAGYGEDHDSWIPLANLTADEVLARWRAKRQAPVVRRVARVIDSEHSGGEVRYLVAIDEDSGPDAYQWVRRSEVANKEALAAFDQAEEYGTDPRLPSGGGVGTADDVSTMGDATYVEPSRGPKKRASTRVAFKSETEPREAASVEDKVEEPRRVTRASAKAAGTTMPPLKYHF